MEKKIVRKKWQEWVSKNPDYYKQKRKEWHFNHKEEENKKARERYRLYKSTPRTRYRFIKNGAKNRGIIFKLTFNQFMTFWRKPCTYCGDAIDLIGLDRVNNKMGYTIGNIASCCSTCNYMKRGLTVAEFVTHCKKVK